MATVGLWVALVALGVASVVYLYKRPAAKLKLPPGPPGIPVLGNLPALIGKTKLPHHTLASLSKRYGPLMFLRLGSRPCIVASSPEVFREIFKNQDQVFASRPRTAAFDVFSQNGRGISFSQYGEGWREMRKLVSMELLTTKRLSEIESWRVAEVSALVAALTHHHTLHGTHKPVILRPVLKAVGFNTITQMAFRKRFYGYHDLEEESTTTSTRSTPVVNDPQVKDIRPEEGKEFNDLAQDVLTMTAVQLIGDFVPQLSFLDRFSGAKSKMANAHDKLHHYLSRVVEEHRTHSDSGPEQRDFLDVLLTLQNKDGSRYLDELSIRQLCHEVVTGGTDTTAFTVEWTMAALMRHPEVASKLMAELDAVVGKERLVTEADIPNLPYLQAVVKESMRLHPVGPLLVPHCSMQQTKVLGYDIPESTTVLANIWAVQRDPAVWDYPLQFRPERFFDKPEIDVKQQHFELLPFGSGRRGCPGMAMGLTSVHYILARLYQAFEWSLPDGMKPEDVDVEEAFQMLLVKANELEAVPIPRMIHA